MDRVLWAARVANAHEFIERLPLGYETRDRRVRPRPLRRPAPAHRHRPRPLPPAAGPDLRRGHERPRHRVGARRPGEHATGCSRAAPSFVIAHRLSTIRNADLILVLERGRLVEKGTPRRADGAPGPLLLPLQPAAGDCECDRRALPPDAAGALGRARPGHHDHGALRVRGRGRPRASGCPRRWRAASCSCPRQRRRPGARAAHGHR